MIKTYRVVFQGLLSRETAFREGMERLGVGPETVDRMLSAAPVPIKQDLTLRDARVYAEAVQEAVRIRVRPIFMSMFTSVLGMSPLVFFAGAGSELYRGLGSVVIGGLALSTVFTLFLIPCLFTLVYGLGQRLKRIGDKVRGND